MTRISNIIFKISRVLNLCAYFFKDLSTAMQNILHLQIFWLTLLIVQARSIEIENAQGRSSKKTFKK